MNKSELQSRYQAIKEELGETQLLAVSKYSGLNEIEALYQMGHRQFGENRVDQLFERAQRASELGLSEIEWHFIGHLQSNKLNKLMSTPRLKAIHSVDSLELWQKLLKKDSMLQSRLEVYIQIKTSFEITKQGVSDSDELALFLEAYRASAPTYLYLAGLMTMAPLRTDNPELAAKESFKKLAAIKEQWEGELGQPLGLSMGMSGDYKHALKYGSTIVRLGSILFGAS